MKERTIWGVLGFVIGAVSGWFARALLLPPPIERPPIIVRGGSIWFDTDAGWTAVDETGDEDGSESREHWKQTDGKYGSVAAFEVTIERDDESIRTFNTKKLTFKHDLKLFRVVIQQDEPRVKPRGLLKKVEGSDNRVKYSGGAGLPIILSWDDDSHTLNADEQVCIEYEFKE